MKKQKLYRYIGSNGILDTTVLLPNTPHILRYRLIADEGKILINSFNYRTLAVDVAEDEIEDWKEINKVSGQD